MAEENPGLVTLCVPSVMFGQRADATCAFKVGEIKERIHNREDELRATRIEWTVGHCTDTRKRRKTRVMHKSIKPYKHWR